MQRMRLTSVRHISAQDHQPRSHRILLEDTVSQRGVSSNNVGDSPLPHATRTTINLDDNPNHLGGLLSIPLWYPGGSDERVATVMTDDGRVNPGSNARPPSNPTTCRGNVCCAGTSISFLLTVVMPALDKGGLRETASPISTPARKCDQCTLLHPALPSRPRICCSFDSRYVALQTQRVRHGLSSICSSVTTSYCRDVPSWTPCSSLNQKRSARLKSHSTWLDCRRGETGTGC